MNAAAPDSPATAYAFPRRIASFFSALGLMVAITCAALAVFSLVGRVPDGAQLFVPAAVGLSMGVLGHMALAVFDIADSVCGNGFGSKS